MAFDHPTIVRDVDSFSLQSANARTLEIAVSDATVIGAGSGSGKTLLIGAGATRFGQDRDNDSLEDHRNEDSQDSELDGVASHRTVVLNLRLRYASNGQDLINGGRLVGATSLSALGNVGLTTLTDSAGNANFGVAADTAKTELVEPQLTKGNSSKDLWFFTDASAELSGDEGSQINRLAYQSWALLKAPGEA